MKIEKVIAEEVEMNKYVDMFLVFFKIGIFTIGGGYAMVPLIQDQIVNQKKWMEEDEFIDILAVAQSSPGPIAVNTAVFVGDRVGGKFGVLCTTLGAVLPSFLIILLIAMFFEGIKNSQAFIAIFKGIKPAVVALIVVPVVTMSKKSKINIKNFWIPLTVGVLVAYTSLSPILFIILGMIGGNIYYAYKDKEDKK